MEPPPTQVNRQLPGCGYSQQPRFDAMPQFLQFDDFDEHMNANPAVPQKKRPRKNLQNDNDINMMPPEKKSKPSLHQILSQQASDFENPFKLNQKVGVKELNCSLFVACAFSESL